MTFEQFNLDVLNNLRTTNKDIFKKLSPEDVVFYETIVDRVTSSNALPFDLPAKAVFQLIQKALKFFWEWNEQCVEERTLFLPYSEIKKAKGTKLNRLIQLPNGIEAVFGWHAVDGNFSGDNISQYIHYAMLQNLNTGASFTTEQSTRGAYRENNTSIVNIVTALYEAENWKQLFQRGITANYNKHSQIFSIRTEINNSMVLDCFVRLAPEYMYQIQLFEDYVTALVEERLGKIMNMFEFKYPGGIQPNFTEISSSGKEEREKIEEYLKDANTGAMM